MDECRIYYFLGMLLASSNDYIPVSLKILVFSQLQPRCLHLQLVAVAYCSCSEAFAGTLFFQCFSFECVHKLSVFLVWFIMV